MLYEVITGDEHFGGPGSLVNHLFHLGKGNADLADPVGLFRRSRVNVANPRRNTPAAFRDVLQRCDGP